MTSQTYRGVRFRRTDTNTVVIERQIVNGVKIPELEVNVSFEGKIFTIDTAHQFVIDNLLQTRTVLTKTGAFYNDAYDKNLLGEINFKDIRSGFLGLSDSDARGEFVRRSTAFTGDIIDLPFGDDYSYNFDVPGNENDIEIQRDRILSLISDVQLGVLSLEDTGITQSILQIALSSAAAGNFAFITGHELGGHGNNPNFRHYPNFQNVSPGSPNSVLNDIAYLAGALDMFNLGYAFAPERRGLVSIGDGPFSARGLLLGQFTPESVIDIGGGQVSTTSAEDLFKFGVLSGYGGGKGLHAFKSLIRN
jgi:hypothetical protein